MREGERGRARASEGEYACESFIAETEKDRGGGKKTERESDRGDGEYTQGQGEKVDLPGSKQ